MSQWQEIVEYLQRVSQQPGKAVSEELKRTGGKAIGCFYYAPQELVQAAGMLPVGMWGGNVPLQTVRSWFPSFYCSIVQSTLEMGIQGQLDVLSGMIVTAHCDSLRSLGQNWKVAVPQVEFIPLVHPVNRKSESGIEFLVSEYGVVKEILERISGQDITEEKLTASIVLLNRCRQALRRFTEESRHYPEIITPAVRHAVIYSGYFLERRRYTQLVTELTDALAALSRQKWSGSRVVLSGIKLDSAAVLKALEKNKIAVVGDDLAQESRLFRYDVPEIGGTAMQRLARYWSVMEGCTLLYDPDKQRGNLLQEMVKKMDAQGVLYSMVKFCDPDEFDYPIIKQELEAAGIPHVLIETDLETNYDGQAETRLQAFSEILSS